MTEADADRVGEVGFAAWAANPVLNDCGADVSERVCSAFRDFAATGSKVILVAESDGDIVGWIARDGEADYVSDLWVDPDCQGRGVGRALIEHVFSLMRHEGVECARIHWSNAQVMVETRARVHQGGATGGELPVWAVGGGPAYWQRGARAGLEDWEF